MTFTPWRVIHQFAHRGGTRFYVSRTGRFDDGRTVFEELRGPNGRTIAFRSEASAKAKADQLNAERPKP